MACHTKVLNLTTGRRLKRSQAVGRIEHCLSAWIEEGHTIRDLTLAEMVRGRSERARLREPLPMVEIPGLLTTGIDTAREYLLANQANQLFAQAVVR